MKTRTQQAATFIRRITSSRNPNLFFRGSFRLNPERKASG